MFLARLFPAFLICLLICTSSKAQSDYEFWFAAPEVSKHNQDFDRPIKLWITTYGQKATVTVSHPAQPTLTPIVVKVPKDGTIDVDLTHRIGTIETPAGNMVSPTGLLIKSTAPITVYYEVVSEKCMCNPEFFVLKGKNALGTDFMIPSQNAFDNSSAYTPRPFSSFDIVATQNGTTVTITPSNNVLGHSAGIPFNITLNAGQVYSAQAVSQTAALHLQGSVVTSDKPVAITIKDDLLWQGAGTCADLTGDQIVPVNKIGKEYIAVNGLLAIKDRLFVTATANNTKLYQDNVYIATIQRGETHMLVVNNASTYVTASEPVYVLQLTGMGCEFGSALLPSLGCTGSYGISFTRSSAAPLYINLLVRNGGQGGFLVNGSGTVVTASMFSQVPGTGGLYYSANVPLTTFTVGQAISVLNTDMMFHLGVLHGSGTTGARFGYFSNYGSIAPVVWTTTPLCEYDTVQLFTYKIKTAKYAWSGPGGFSSAVTDPYIFPALTSLSGNYKLVMDANGCTGESEVDITINVKPVLNATPRVAYVCPDQSVEIKVSGADSFAWEPAPGINTLQGGTVTVTPSARTKYYVKGFMLSSECANTDSALVDILPLPNVKIDPDKVVKCPASTVPLTVSGAVSYSWNPTNYLNAVSGPNVITSAPKSINYVVTAVGANGCIGKDTATITVGDTVEQIYSFAMCADSLVPFGDTVISGAGSYTHHFESAYGCDSIVTLNISNKPHPNADFIFTPVDPVLNEPIQFHSRSTDAVAWKWVFDVNSSTEENPLYLFRKTGKHNVCLEVRNMYHCPDTICKPVDALINMAVALPLAFTPNGDGANDILYLYGGVVTKVHLRIYNRWGQMVFETKDMKQGWDGTFKGEPQRPDAYAYRITAEFVDGNTYTHAGSITLIR